MLQTVPRLAPNATALNNATDKSKNRLIRTKVKTAWGMGHEVCIKYGTYKTKERKGNNVGTVTNSTECRNY